MRNTPFRLSLTLGIVFIAFPLGAFPRAASAPQAASPQATPTPPPPPPAETAPVAAFGYNIFKAAAEPVVEGPVSEDFILSPGDEVIVSVWGQLNLRYPIKVSEDGYLELKDEGARIYTNGVSLRELRRLVTEAFAGSYSSYINLQNPAQSTAFVDVKLGQIRKVLAYVVGEVKTQGQYTISASVATLLNLLNMAGGVMEKGSLRDIRIRRSNGTTETVDLYEFLITAKIDIKKTQIRQGDYIIVPLKTKAVAVKGEVRRPAVYEVIGKEGLRDLVSFAGGLSPNAYFDRVQVRRFETNRGERFIDLNLGPILEDAKNDFPLEDGDEISVFPNVLVRRRMVEIRGEGVIRPGTYEFKAGMTLKDLIEKAGGLREHVYLDRADLMRTEEDFSKKLTIFSLRDLYTEVKPGVFEFSEKAEKNFVLREMDEISIYSAFGMAGRDKHVKIEGHVKEQGTYVLAKNMTLYDIVFARGGFQDPDYRRTVYLDLGHVIRKVTGTVGQQIIPFNLGKLIGGDAAANFPLQDEDLVRVYANEEMTIKGKVEIGGLVNRPGTYDLSENLTVEDLIVLAGGLRADAYKVEAGVARAEEVGEGAGGEGAGAARKEATIQVPIEKNFAVLPQARKTGLKAFDKVTVRNLPGWEPLQVVSVRGEVIYPGQYSLASRSERISSLIKRMGGLKPEAFPEGATMTRRGDIVAMSPGGAAGAAAAGLAAAQEIALNLAGALENPGGDDDLILKDGDDIYIPGNPGTVEVRGAVKRPMILQHKAGLRIKDYVELCGGYLESADKANLAVYAANKAAQRIKRGLFSSSNPEVAAGSTIEVPFIGEATRLEAVEVKGAVVRPAVVQYIKGAKLGYYLNLCGGYSKEADVEKVAIHLPDGGLLVKQENVAFNPAVLPGSIIVVTTKTNK